MKRAKNYSTIDSICRYKRVIKSWDIKNHTQRHNVSQTTSYYTSYVRISKSTQLWQQRHRRHFLPGVFTQVPISFTPKTLLDNMSHVIGTRFSGFHAPVPPAPSTSDDTFIFSSTTTTREGKKRRKSSLICKKLLNARIQTKSFEPCKRLSKYGQKNDG